jgi:hypothetical protein
MLARSVLALAAASLAATASAASLTRQPYVQDVTPTTAVVAFRSDTDCDATVRYGTGALDRSATSPKGRIHGVRLEGLEPGATYQYRVEICGSTASEPKRLRTAPQPGTRSVHFGAAGDFGTGAEKQIAVGKVMQQRDPDLFLALGDLAYDNATEAELQAKCFAPWAELLDEVPLYGSLGNHEYNTAMAGPYLANLHLPTNNAYDTERYYSFDWGHVHFVALDTNCRGRPTPECTFDIQKKWLEADLAANRLPWVVAFHHHPPYSTGEHGSSLDVRAAFSPIYEKYGVDLVLAGHDHEYERMKPIRAGEPVEAGTPGAVQYVVVGSGGARIKGFPTAWQPWDAYRNDQDHGYLDVKVEGGTLTAEFVGVDGKVLDRFTMTKELPPGAAPVPANPDMPGNPPLTPDGTPVGGGGGGGDGGTPQVQGPGQGGGGCGNPTGGGAIAAALALFAAAWALRRRSRRLHAGARNDPRRH